MSYGLHHTCFKMVKVSNWKFQWIFCGHLPIDCNFSIYGRKGAL